MSSVVRLRSGSLLAILAVVACTPHLPPLRGAPVPVPIRLPAGALPVGHHQVVFQWQFDDGEMTVRGEGVARLASPDSARLDFFLSGMGGGSAVLIGDSLSMSGGDDSRSFVPPVPLLWATLGRVAVPALPDTAARVDGSILRADIGHPVAWRLTFRADSLARVERVTGGRIAEWVERGGGTVRYRDETTHRELRLTVTRTADVDAFDPSIWAHR